MAFYTPPLSHLAYPVNRTNSGNAVPRRSDSLAGKPGIFQLVTDDLHDARRVLNHGQEEDLKTALQRVIGRVEEMSTMLKSAYAKQTELETNLTLTKSNLKMAQANTELLEDMLRRNQARRSLVESQSGGPGMSPHEDTRRYTHDGLVPPEVMLNASPVTPVSAVSRKEEGGFFASWGRSRGNSPPATATAHLKGLNHIASASMPSLVPEGSVAAAAAVKQIEDLKAELDGERTKLKKASDDKTALEAELESLSQALFEEANKMVATERIKAAEVGEELTEVRRQCAALTSALRVVETENTQLRQSSGFLDSAPPSAAMPTFGGAPADITPQPLDQKGLHRAPSNLSLKSPVARPPRSPMRRSNSLSTSSAGSRPGSPLVSSPLASRSTTLESPRTSPHASPQIRSTTSLGPSVSRMSLPILPPELTIQDASPPVVAGAHQQSYTNFIPPPESQLFQEITPTPTGSGIAAPLQRSISESPTPRPLLERRSTTQATVRKQEPDFHDPNLPEEPPIPQANPDAPLFTLPTLPSFKDINQNMSSLARSLPSSPSLKSASLGSWLPSSSPSSIKSASSGRPSPVISPEPSLSSTSPDPNVIHSEPINIPGGLGKSHSVQSEEESPWADMISSARPALNRMSSVSSIASERFSMGIGRAREVIASFAPALDDEETLAVGHAMRSGGGAGGEGEKMSPNSPRMQRASSIGGAAFGGGAKLGM